MYVPDQALDQAVGRVARAAASLEGLTLAVLCQQIGMSQSVGRLVLPDTMDRRLSAIKDTLQHADVTPEFDAHVRSWAGSARKAYSERSLIVHSIWVPTDAEMLRSMHASGDFSIRAEHLLPGVRVYSPFPKKRESVVIADMRSLEDMARAAETLAEVEHDLARIFAGLAP